MNYCKKDYIKEMYMCYSLYTEYGFSLAKIGKELCIGAETVRRRLETLKYYDDDLYCEYRKKAKERSKRKW